MGKNSRRRRNKHRRRKRRERETKALARAEGRPVCRVRLDVEELEIAKGHDGLFRGMPEPTMLLAVYRVDGARVALMARYLYRFTRPAEAFPCKVSPRDDSRESVVVPFDDDTRIVVLALAVEEDNGKGVASLYARLERGEEVIVWTDGETAPVPIHLPELHPDRMVPAMSHRVHLLFGEDDPSKVRGDDWIGATLVWMNARADSHRHRLHFVAPDGRNDWTASVFLSVGSA